MPCDMIIQYILNIFGVPVLFSNLFLYIFFSGFQKMHKYNTRKKGEAELTANENYSITSRKTSELTATDYENNIRNIENNVNLIRNESIPHRDVKALIASIKKRLNGISTYKPKKKHIKTGTKKKTIPKTSKVPKQRKLITKKSKTNAKLKQLDVLILSDVTNFCRVIPHPNVTIRKQFNGIDISDSQDLFLRENKTINKHKLTTQSDILSKSDILPAKRSRKESDLIKSLVNDDDDESLINTEKMYDYNIPQPSSAFTAAGEYLSSKLPAHNNNTDESMFAETNSHHSNNNMHNKHILAASMATLCNIGNTCYLNSVVYTLRFAPHFLHNLHHLVEDLLHINNKLVQHKAKSSSLGRNVGGLQGQATRSRSTKDLVSMGNVVGDMPRTHRQIAIEQLHELYTSLRRSEITDSQDAYHADTFLSAVQDVNSIFEGNQQQDAHEFLMCVLDSIRETCQSLTKVIKDCPEILVNG